MHTVYEPLPTDIAANLAELVRPPRHATSALIQHNKVIGYTLCCSTGTRHRCNCYCHEGR